MCNGNTNTNGNTSGAVLNICGSHRICKVASKYLNVCELLEMVEWNKSSSVPPPALPCDMNRQCVREKTMIKKVP